MINASGGSITGQKRASNQDAFVIDNLQKLWIIADGMGGHAAGETAANEICERLPHLLRRHDSTADALHAMHQEIFDLGRLQRALSGMGATVILAQQTLTHLNIYWVGDCRAYSVKDGELAAITKDHSLVQQMVEVGLLQAQQVHNHPKRHIVTQCIGGNKMDMPQVGFTSVELSTMQQVLLCSDGLYNDVSEREMLHIILSQENQQLAVQQLLDRADHNGGHDNATAILLDYQALHAQSNHIASAKNVKTATKNKLKQHNCMLQFCLKLKTWIR